MKNFLAEKAVLANLSIGFWQARRFDKEVTRDTNKRHGAKEDAARVTKRLVAKAAIQKVHTIVSTAKHKHYELTQPWFDKGARILPTAMYADYANAMRDFRIEYEKAVEVFCNEYPTLVEQAKDDLNGMFNEEDYPADIRGKFSFDLTILPCPDAKDFRTDLASEHADDIRRDLENQIQKALNDAMKEPVRRIIEVVGHMAERCRAYKPGVSKAEAKKTGKKQRDTEGKFHDTLVQNVRDLVDLLPKFNLTNDKALADLTKRIAQELCNTEADELREQPAVRKSVAAAAESILAQAQALMS